MGASLSELDNIPKGDLHIIYSMAHDGPTLDDQVTALLYCLIWLRHDDSPLGCLKQRLPSPPPPPPEVCGMTKGTELFAMNAACLFSSKTRLIKHHTQCMMQWHPEPPCSSSTH